MGGGGSRAEREESGSGLKGEGSSRGGDGVVGFCGDRDCRGTGGGGTATLAGVERRFRSALRLRAMLEGRRAMASSLGLIQPLPVRERWVRWAAGTRVHNGVRKPVVVSQVAWVSTI